MESQAIDQQGLAEIIELLTIEPIRKIDQKMDVGLQRKIDQGLGPLICRALSLFAGKREPAGTPQRILIILLSEMGSLVLGCSMFRRIREKYPQASIHALVFEKNREILDLLAGLVDKSLVVYEAEGQGRYCLLGTIREYALERLLESGEVQAVRQGHAEYFLDFMVKTGKKPTQLLQDLFAKVGGEYFYDRIDSPFKGDRSRREQIIRDANPKTIGGLKVTDLVTVDGFQFKLEDGGWMLIRFSGTEPIMRVYCETTHEDKVQAILQDGLKIAGLR